MTSFLTSELVDKDVHGWTYLLAGSPNDLDPVLERLEINHVVRGAKDKLETVKSLAGELGFGLDETCYVGDSVRDAPALAAVAQFSAA